jgi:hypothetical protein
LEIKRNIKLKLNCKIKNSRLLLFTFKNTTVRRIEREREREGVRRKESKEEENMFERFEIKSKE